jgi:hypothetical protein
MPDGRPKKRTPINLSTLARSHTDMAVKVLAGVAQNSEQDAARVSAATALLDRGWGKPAQPVTGKDGVEDIQVVIRTIIEGPKK